MPCSVPGAGTVRDSTVFAGEGNRNIDANRRSSRWWVAGGENLKRSHDASLKDRTKRNGDEGDDGDDGDDGGCGNEVSCHATWKPTELADMCHREVSRPPRSETNDASVAFMVILQQQKLRRAL